MTDTIGLTQDEQNIKTLGERIMAWKLGIHFAGNFDGVDKLAWFDEKGDMASIAKDWNPLENPADTHQVISAMMARGYEPSLIYRHTDWHADWYRRGQPNFWVGTEEVAASFGRAACLSALKAIEAGR